MVKNLLKASISLVLSERGAAHPFIIALRIYLIMFSGGIEPSFRYQLVRNVSMDETIKSMM